MSAQLVLTGDFGNGYIGHERPQDAEADRSVATGSAETGVPSKSKMRLTRRGRIVLGGLATVLIAATLALFAAFGAPRAVAADEASGEDFHYIVVQQGSSLWNLVGELDPKADPRDLIAEIVQLNQLDGSGVQAGEALAVPLRYSDNPMAVTAEEAGL